MTFHERLRNLESRFRPEPFPDFEACCKRRWTPRQWFARLAESGDLARVRGTLAQLFCDVPESDDDLLLWLKTSDPKSLAPPAGSVPHPRSGPDEFLMIVSENMRALKTPRKSATD